MNRLLAAVAAATLVLSGCPAHDSSDGDGIDDAAEWRDGAPNPGQIAAEVAALRAQPMVLDPSTAVGTLPGVPDVGARGQATWTMGIDVAPGVAGMTPEISVSYDSNRGNGSMGVGFALVGVSSVRRCTRTILDDGASAPASWTNADALCLGGDRLVLDSGTYGEDGAHYRLAHDPSVRIVQHAPLGSMSSYFEAFHSGGHILTYGTAAATLWRGPNASFGQPYVWGLAQRRDRFGNTIDYAYDFPTPLSNGPGEMRLRTARYGGTGPEASRREVSLDYEPRPDALDSWWFGAHQRSTSRLARVTASGPGGAEIRSYRFAYDAVGAAHRSHLTSIALCDAADVCMPPTTFEWGAPANENWSHHNLDFDLDISYGLDSEELIELLLAMSGALVTDMDGDLAHELLLRHDGTGSTGTTFWRPETDAHSFELDLASPPAMPSYLDSAIAAEVASGGPSAALLARVQPALGAAVVNADGDRLSDVLVPWTPFGSEAHLDPDGYLHGQGFTLAHGQSTPLGDPEPQVIDVVSYFVPDPSGERTYTMIPIDHEGDLATDAWLCRGESATDSHWVLMRGEADGTGATEPFSYHPTDLPCSVHDELTIEPRPAGGQRLLVIPAYDEDGDPIDDDDRVQYSRLEYDLDLDVASWQPTSLPRDRYQRWHDRQCRNGVAHAIVGLPVYGAGMGLDRQLDVNGDGLVDVLRFELAAGDGVAAQPEIVEDLRTDTAGLGAGDWLSPQICDASVEDHRDAVIRLWQNTGEGYHDGGVVHEFEGIAHANFWLNFVGAQLLDVNDDAAMDLVLPSTGPGGEWTLLASRGDGTFAANDTGLPVGWPAYTADATWEEQFDLGERVRTFGLGVDKDTENAGSEVNDERPGLLFVGFIEGGGLDWLTVANVWEPGDPNQGEHVTEIVDGLGRTTRFEFEMVDASDVETVTGPRVPLPVATWVTKGMCVEAQTEAYPQYDAHDGDDLMAQRCTTFDYTGAVVDRWGRGLLGFEEIRSRQEGWVDDHASIWIWGAQSNSWTRYSVEFDSDLDDYPTAGRPLDRIVLTSVPDVGSEVSRTSWTWARVPTPIAGGRTLLTYASEVRERSYAPTDLENSENVDEDEIDDLDPYRDVVHTETRDLYGTVLSSIRDTNLGERVEVTAHDVVHDTTQWLLGQVARIEVESCAHYGDCKVRTTEFTYTPNTGLPSETVIEPGDPDLELATSVLREGHGNVWLSIATPANGAPRTAMTGWDAEGVHPVSVTNALGHVSHVIHDVPSGAVRAMVEPGGTTRTFRYDGFYRERVVDRLTTPLGASDGAATTTEYLGGSDPAWPQVPAVAMRIRKTQALGPQSTTHLNRLGQPVLEVWQGAAEILGAVLPTIGPGDEVFRRTRYDIHGEVGERSLPQWIGKEPLWEHVDRDMLGRPTRSVAADGTVMSTTNYSHQTGLVASTLVATFDANGIPSQVELDADGRTVRSVDRLGVAVCLVPGAFGDVISSHRNCGYQATGPQPVTTMTYDTVGNLVSEVETGWGTKHYEYNAFGELDRYTDGNGDQSTYALDALGRVTSRSDTDGETTVVWDTERPGRPSSETSPDGVITSRTYDGFGRTEFEHTIVPSNSGPDDYVFEYVWEAGDRLRELVYPAVDGEPGLRTRMQYDATGRMRAITNTSDNTLLWVWRRAAANDAVEQETTVGGTTTTRTWDEARGWPLRIDTLGATTLQKLEYGWRPDGELDWREDEQNGVQRETFIYDDARRLTTAQISQGTPLVPKTPQTLTYDAVGNIKTKSGIGTYTYDADGKLMTIGTASVFHDGQGNIVSQGSRSLTYTAFDKVRTATSGATSLAFTYDASGARVRRTAGNLQTISIGALYERELSGAASTNLNYHVVANGRVVARIERTKFFGAWSSETRGMHDDMLGSTGVLSTSGGAVHKRVAHDAWGAARKATDWTAAEKDADAAAVGRGFTGHRARLDTGLVDMGGRMYDPRVARFTSADPVLADALDPQGWNRYSYVGNRPLVFTDPSGWIPKGAREMSMQDFSREAEKDGYHGWHRQIIVPSGDADPGVGWRDTGGGGGLGMAPHPGGYVRDVGNGWFRINLRGFGSRLYHVNGISIADTADGVREYTQKYYARLYPPKDEGNPMQAVLDFAAGLDVAAEVGLAIAGTVNPIARVVQLGISVGDGAGAAAQGDVAGVATAAAGIVPIPGLSRAAKAVPKAFEIGPRVAGQLKDPRLGSLAGKLTPDRLQKLVNSPSAQRVLDARTGNINVIQEVEGRLLRITVPQDAFKIISVGPIRARNVSNSIANGRFVPLP